MVYYKLNCIEVFFSPSGACQTRALRERPDMFEYISSELIDLDTSLTF
jgi:hypothetical protein